MLVGPDNKAMLRNVISRRGRSATNWVVTSGLKAGDKVIIEGLEPHQAGPGGQAGPGRVAAERVAARQSGGSAPGKGR